MKTKLIKIGNRKVKCRALNPNKDIFRKGDSFLDEDGTAHFILPMDFGKKPDGTLDYFRPLPTKPRAKKPSVRYTRVLEGKWKRGDKRVYADGLKITVDACMVGRNIVDGSPKCFRPIRARKPAPAKGLRPMKCWMHKGLYLSSNPGYIATAHRKKPKVKFSYIEGIFTPLAKGRGAK